MPWLVVMAVVLVVPGTALSIALGGIGLLMLLALGVDYLVARGGSTDRPAVAVQLGVAVAVALVLGAAIGLGAWIIE